MNIEAGPLALQRPQREPQRDGKRQYQCLQYNLSTERLLMHA